jgi:hypothetical protein
MWSVERLLRGQDGWPDTGPEQTENALEQRAGEGERSSCASCIWQIARGLHLCAE